MIYLALYNVFSTKGKNHLGKDSFSALCGFKDAEWMGGEIEIHPNGIYVVDGVTIPAIEVERMYCNKCLNKVRDKEDKS